VDAQAISITVALLVGMTLGAIAAWMVARNAHAKSAEVAVAKIQAELGAELARLAERAGQLEKASALVRADLDSEKQARSTAEAESARLNTALAELKVTIDNERRSAQEKLALLDEAKQKLSSEFQLLANRIFEDKSNKLSEQNKSALGELLDPLRTQLKEFKGKVEEVYVQEGKDRSALSEQVRQLLTLNQSLSQDAQNLTDALKGNAQVRGAWGEWVLEEMLTSSGLMKDEHYVLQDSKRRDDGTRARPDALINLPGGRQLVIDSKVSLVAYDQYSSAKGDEERALALRGHLDSMKKHITGLSDREYQKLYPTMDFVMMFVPIEPAFMVAAANERQLFSQAWEKNVLLVSPSTLLFVLRTVAYLWRQEDQNRNAQAIADRGSKLFDKFCDFLRDLELLGQRLEQAHTAFTDARSKLHDGNGNLISQARKLNELGVKGSKKIPTALLQLSDPDAEVVSDLASLAASNTPPPAA
jgi:DNA recombination protein RmuC